MVAILIFFIAHWYLSLIAQSVFLHRYAAHGYYTLTPFWEKAMHFFTWFAQGSSYLSPRAYGIMHLAHHVHSDTEKDPHSPHHAKGLTDMMLKTADIYSDVEQGNHELNQRFKAHGNFWEPLDEFGNAWPVRIGWGVVYFLFYVAFAPSWHWYLLLPIHWLMGPVHGAIVNWGGHKYGYQNFDNGDKSRNSLPVDLLMAGELYQNNHHKYGNKPNFATRWWEFDPGYWVLRLLSAVGIAHIKSDSEKVQRPIS